MAICPECNQEVPDDVGYLNHVDLVTFVEEVSTGDVLIVIVNLEGAESDPNGNATETFTNLDLAVAPQQVVIG